MSARTKPVLLEREAELAELEAALEDARVSGGRVVFVEGAAGIGKTRLVEASCETAERIGMRALSARSTELEQDFPFAVVRQLFEPVVRRASAAERNELLDDAARLAAPVVGVQSTARAHDDGSSGAIPAFATLNALYWLTSNLAERRPLVLAIDDAHWCDRASLRFLMFLLPRVEDLPVALVLALREGEAGADAELLSRLRADSVARVLRPAPLSAAAAAELVRGELVEAEDQFCAACHEASGGNPFMLRELLLELRAEKSTGALGEAARVRELAPASIQRAVFARLARLPNESRALARAMAVLGDDAELAEAAAVAGFDRTTADVAADALVATGTVEDGRPLRFAHPLLRNAVYAAVSRGEKVVLHRRAAETLKAGGAAPQRIAVHLLATDPEGDHQVVDVLGAAAQRALEQGAQEAAIAYIQRALVEPPEAGERPALLRSLMTASFFSMDRVALDDVCAGVLGELATEPETLMAAASEIAPQLLYFDRTEDGLSLLESATGAALDTGDYDLVLRFQAQAGLWGHAYRPTDGVRWDQLAHRIAPDTPGERIWLTTKALSSALEGEPAARVAAFARRAVQGGAIFEEQRDPMIGAVPILMLIRADDFGIAERALEHFADKAKPRGFGWTVTTAWLRARLAYGRGQVARAEPYARSVVDATRQRSPLGATWRAVWLGPLIDVLIERGALDAAEHELTTSDLRGDVPDSLWTILFLLGRGRLRLAQGRISEGLDDLLEVVGRRERHDVKDPGIPTDAVAALALAGAGERDAARRMAASYRRTADTWGTLRAKGLALRCQGVIEGGERGIELLREAVAILSRSPARLEHARAMTDLGAALRRANHRAEARQPLRNALDFARREGAFAIARRAHEELEATGEKLRPLQRSGVESLTPSERRIAAMAAEGKTNRAIAQDLFLTVKTIEAHLSSVYRKLDIGSRSELHEALTVECRG